MTTHLKHKPRKIIAQHPFKIQSQFRFLCFETGPNSIRQNSYDQSTYRRQIRSQNLKYRLLTTAYQPGSFPSINVSHCQNHSLLNPTEGEHGKRGRCLTCHNFLKRKKLSRSQRFWRFAKDLPLVSWITSNSFLKKWHKKRRRARATCFCQPPLGPKPTSVPTSHHSTRWLKPNGIERLKPSDHSANSSCSPPPHQKKNNMFVAVLVGLDWDACFLKKRSLTDELGQITQSNSRKVDSRPFWTYKNLTWESSQNGGKKNERKMWTLISKDPSQTLEIFRTSVITIVRYKHNRLHQCQLESELFWFGTLNF